MKKLLIVFSFTFLSFCFIPQQASADMSLDGKSYVVEEDETWYAESFTGDVFIPKGKTLTTEFDTTIYGNIYVLGTLVNNGKLTVNGTLNCLNYSRPGMSFTAGDYDYGFLESNGTLSVQKLNIMDNYLSIPIPVTHVHNWKELYIEKENCFTNWVKIYYCTGCAEEKRESITPIGHVFSSWQTISPSCSISGKKYRICEECGYEETEEIKATGNHQWGAWKTTKKATALAKGRQTHECLICYTEQSRTLPKLKAKVTLKKKSITIKRKKSYTLKIKSRTYGDKVSKWKTSNKKIATVSSKGKIKAKKKGRTTITLYMKSGAKASCRVKVK